MKRTIARQSHIIRSPRVMQLEGMFDVPPAAKSALTWQVNLPLDEKPWNVGLIVGPSGCGKSTVAREMFGDAYTVGFDWPADRALLDGFPAELSIKDVTLLLSSVGFSSPPSWVRPFHVLSNGEQFRATLARALATKSDLCVFDEFTSVVDRTVGRIGSAAVAKAVRRRKGKFVAVTCHDDVLEWLDPDWVYSPVDNSFQWRLLRRRPPIELEICRVHHSTWALFAPHHYLTASLARSAFCFAAFLDGRPVAFDAWMPFFGRSHGRIRRGHRTVCLPDYQGVGIGNALFTRLAGMWRGLGFRAVSGTGHPAEIAHRVRSPNWRMTSAPTRHARGKSAVDRARAVNRLVASFEYIGPALLPADAQKQLNSWAVTRAA
ncbi:MAG: ABC transporter ATP-binding protein [Alphaproteobacteria bacterium]|nr:MAG: ABC transporter ATP-binding protein [Alphaproteobacteria bacterium]